MVGRNDIREYWEAVIADSNYTSGINRVEGVESWGVIETETAVDAGLKLT